MVVWVHLFGMLQGDGWEGPLFGRASNDEHRSTQKFTLHAPKARIVVSGNRVGQ